MNPDEENYSEFEQNKDDSVVEKNLTIVFHIEIAVKRFKVDICHLLARSSLNMQVKN